MPLEEMREGVFGEQLSIRLHFHRQLPNFRLEFVSCREDVFDLNLIC